MKKYLVLLIFVNVVFISFLHGQRYTLTFNPKPGDKYDVTSSMKSKMAQNIMGQDMNINMSYDINMTYNIAADGADKRLNMTYDKLKMNMEAMGQSITMDSENTDSANVINTPFKALKGQTISVILDARGNVVRVEGAEEILEKVTTDDMQKQTLNNILGEDAMKNLMAQAFGFYPDKPVKVGDSWSDTMIIKSPYEITAANTYTLIKVDGGKAFISTVSKLTTNPDSKMSYNGIEMTMDLTGDISSTSEVNVDSGMPVVTNTRQNLKGNIEVQGQKVPMAMYSDIVIKVNQK